MPPQSPPVKLLARAADLRAGGASWEVVASQLGRPAEVVRRWPARYPAWARLFRAAERRLLAEATAESVLTLRKLLRSGDEKVARDAAARLIQFRVAADRRRPTSKPSAGPPTSDFRRAAAYLETLPHDQIDRLLDDALAAVARDRADRGQSDPPPPGPGVA